VFENVIGHNAVVDTLRRELEEGTLPSSVLLHGPAFSGKLSTALEIARVLTCQERAAWSCACPSCRKQRLLVHPNTVLMGSRYFELEIAASADTLRRNPKTASQYLFVRAVRKLTRRFDPFLWEGEETAVRGLQPVLAEVEEELDFLLPASGGEIRVEGKKLEQRLAKLQDLCLRLTGALSAETIPINQIRRAAAWLHMSALGAPAVSGRPARKILILENADRMYEASSNSLLKLLEEPPAEVYLLLLTGRPGALIPTVRSRLRPYLLAERSGEEEAEVLQRIFHEEGGDYRSLREYFLYWNDVNPEMLRSLARRFIRSVLGDESVSPAADAVDGAGPAEAGRVLEELSQAASTHLNRSRKDRGFVPSFVEELMGQLELLLREGGLSPFRLERWNRAIRDHVQAFGAYNQHPVLTLESLYYSLRSME
jgi:DNA polymerase III delta prime subunit